MRFSPEHKRTGRRGGFTLMELLLATSIALIVFGSIAYFLSHSTKLFSTMQNQTETSSGAYQALSKLTNDLMQAGADLPELDTSLRVPRNDSIVLWSNPRAAYAPITRNATTDTMLVQDARPFFGLSTVRHFVYDPTTPQWQTRTLAQVDTVQNFLRFTAAVTFSRADVLYDRVMASYSLDGSAKQIVYKPAGGVADPIAENVDGLVFFFKDKQGNATVQWSKMKTCSLCVTVHPPTEPTRRSTVCRRFFFRNRTTSN